MALFSSVWAATLNLPLTYLCESCQWAVLMGSARWDRCSCSFAALSLSVKEMCLGSQKNWELLEIWEM